MQIEPAAQTAHSHEDRDPLARPLISVQETTWVLGGLSLWTVWKLIRERHLEVRKIGGRTLVTTASIRAYIATLPGHGEAA